MFRYYINDMLGFDLLGDFDLSSYLNMNNAIMTALVSTLTVNIIMCYTLVLSLNIDDKMDQVLNQLNANVQYKNQSTQYSEQDDENEDDEDDEENEEDKQCDKQQNNVTLLIENLYKFTYTELKKRAGVKNNKFTKAELILKILPDDA